MSAAPGAGPPPGPVRPRSRVRLQISGMSCAACVSRVEAALREVPHVRDASVNLALAQADVVADGEPDHDALEDAVARAGFTAAACRARRRPPIGAA